ncbi:MAG: DUF805 domain-containing protein [Flammeovirgaceae bacterium]
MSRIKSTLNEANDLFANQSYEEALELYQQAYKLSPLNSEVSWGLIACQLKLREFQQALEVFEGALKRAISKTKHADAKRKMAALLFKEMSYANAWEVFSSIPPSKHTAEDTYLSIKYQLFVTRTPDLDDFLEESIRKDPSFFKRLLADESVSEARKEQLQEKEVLFHEFIQKYEAEQVTLKQREEEERLAREAQKQEKLEQKRIQQQEAMQFFKEEKRVLYRTMIFTSVVGVSVSIVDLIFKSFDIKIYEYTSSLYLIRFLENFAFAAMLGIVLQNMRSAIITGLSYTLGLTLFFAIMDIFEFQKGYFITSTFTPFIFGFLLGYVAIITSTTDKNAAMWAGIGGALGSYLGNSVYNLYSVIDYSEGLFEFIGLMASIVRGFTVWGMILLFRTLAFQQPHQQILKNILSFRGKIGRLRCFLRVLVIGGLTLLTYTTLVSIARYQTYFYAEFDEGVVLMVTGIKMIIAVLMLLSLTLIQAAQIVKRLRDSGESPYMYFLGFLPIVNIYLLYLVYFKEGDGSRTY